MKFADALGYKLWADGDGDESDDEELLNHPKVKKRMRRVLEIEQKLGMLENKLDKHLSPEKAVISSLSDRRVIPTGPEGSWMSDDQRDHSELVASTDRYFAENYPELAKEPIQQSVSN